MPNTVIVDEDIVSVVTVDEEPNVVTILNDNIQVVSVAEQGPIGPPGPTGPSGGDGFGEITMPIVDSLTALNLSAGSASDLDGTPIANTKTGKLLYISLASSVACKWEIKKINGVSSITVDVVYTGGLCEQPTMLWRSPAPDFVTQVGNGTDIYYRVTATNLDAHNSADVHSTLYMDEV